MNNLFLALILLAAATVAWLNRYAANQMTQSQMQALSGKLAACESSLRFEQATAAESDARLKQLRALARTAQEELVQASAEARELVSPADVAGEGTWPANRDYFYLPKQFLGSIGYGVFHNDGTLSEEAARLFGLTPAEKVALTDSWRQLCLELQQAELNHVERLEPRQADSDDHREVVFRVSSTSNDVAELQDQFQRNLQTQFGSTRGDLIWAKVSTQRPLDGYPLGFDDRILTYSAERQPDGSVQHRLGFTKPDKSTSYSFPITFDQPEASAEPGAAAAQAATGREVLSPDSALWPYRHLFGDQPLLQPQARSGGR
ncbi:MAG: hypothetical protein U1G07_25970 [Verrucomicrobiota bacterium]